MIYSRFLLSILYILVCVCNQLVRVAEDTIGVLCVCVCVCVGSGDVGAVLWD